MHPVQLFVLLTMSSGIPGCQNMSVSEHYHFIGLAEIYGIALALRNRPVKLLWTGLRSGCESCSNYLRQRHGSWSRGPLELRSGPCLKLFILSVRSAASSNRTRPVWRFLLLRSSSCKSQAFAFFAYTAFFFCFREAIICFYGGENFPVTFVLVPNGPYCSRSDRISVGCSRVCGLSLLPPQHVSLVPIIDYLFQLLFSPLESNLLGNQTWLP